MYIATHSVERGRESGGEREEGERKREREAFV